MKLIAKCNTELETILKNFYEQMESEKHIKLYKKIFQKIKTKSKI